MIAWPIADLLPHAGDMILLDGVEQDHVASMPKASSPTCRYAPAVCSTPPTAACRPGSVSS